MHVLGLWTYLILHLLSVFVTLIVFVFVFVFARQVLDLFGLILASRRDGVCGEQLLNWAQRDVGCHRPLQIFHPELWRRIQIKNDKYYLKKKKYVIKR